MLIPPKIQQIFDFIYDKNEEKKKRMKRINETNDLNLNTLIEDGILEYIQSIKVIAVVSKNKGIVLKEGGRKTYLFFYILLPFILTLLLSAS